MTGRRLDPGTVVLYAALVTVPFCAVCAAAHLLKWFLITFFV